MDIRIQEVEHSYRQQNLVEKSAFIQHSPASKKALMKAGLARSEEERRLLLKLLLSLQDFAKFPDLVRTELTKMVTMRDVKEGEIVFEQGSYGSAWYTILSGSCNVYMEREGKREQISHMLAGSSFGEKALVQSPKRTATVIAAEKTELLVVERDDYLKTVKFAHEKDLAEKVDFFHGIATFNKLTRKVISELASVCMLKKYPPNKTIILEGTDPDYFYIIRSGSCSVLMLLSADIPTEFGSEQPSRKSKTKHVSKIVQVKALVPGSYFGEISLIRNSKRTATVISKTEVELYAINQIEFSKIIVGEALSLFRKNLDLYPEDHETMDRFVEHERTIQWKRYKRHIVAEIMAEKAVLKKFRFLLCQQHLHPSRRFAASMLVR
eukprot:TRINITY_DN121_c0_g1_i5.p1 TRINITY_DN121_c0_g1~~TRINITY_DN121_c0_g1_i5.p1  ORF type:complete len:381 (-),score=82.99 TRINITY_DN121_c0_g1_i5:154-1296(-)